MALPAPAPPPSPEAEITPDIPAPNGTHLRTIALVGLLIIAAVFLLHVGRGFFLPFVLAILFDFLLTPPVRYLARFRIPEPVGAALVLVVLLGGIGFGTYQLAEPAQRWAAQAPKDVAKLRSRLREILRPVEAVQKTAEQVQQAAGPETPRVVTVDGNESLTSKLFGTTQAFLIGSFEMIVLLYFLLAAGPLFTLKLVRVLPRLRDKKKAIQIAREVEASVSRYLVVLAAINVAEGIVVGIALWLLGLPNPVLWGALATVLIFIPYVGAAMMIGILFLVSATTFDSLGHVLAVPAAFFAIDVIQANIVSPPVLGNRMMLNPVAVFVSILLWGAIWGIAGVLIAVPLAVTLKIFCDHVESLAGLGEFLGK